MAQSAQSPPDEGLGLRFVLRSVQRNSCLSSSLLTPEHTCAQGDVRGAECRMLSVPEEFGGDLPAQLTLVSARVPAIRPPLPVPSGAQLGQLPKVPRPPLPIFLLPRIAWRAPSARQDSPSLAILGT